MTTEAWDEGEVLVLDYFMAEYTGANDVTFGGIRSCNVRVTDVENASNEIGTNI